MKVLVLSPHYDDAPLSLGQSMLDGVLSELDVTVGIVFGRSNWVRWFHPTRSRTMLASGIRRCEEFLASRLFGYRLAIGSCEEAVLRHDSSDTEVYLSESFVAAGSSDLEFVSAQVDRWSAKADWILAPLGLGHHVDHQLLAQVGLELRQSGRKVAFYEDRPYACMMGDEEIETFVADRFVGLERYAVSEPISPNKHRRLFYPSQFDDFFTTAIRLDEEMGRPEYLWGGPDRLE